MKSKNKNAKWKRFEQLVGKIQQELSPDATVTIDDKIKGRNSKTNRQIDISVRKNIGQFNILIVIDCKDYSDPIDVKVVEEFLGLVEDVGANKGALVSSSGYSKAAKNRARNAGVDIYKLVDAQHQDWISYATVPCLCDFRGTGKMKFKFRSMEFIGNMLTGIEPQKLQMYNVSRKIIGSPVDIVWAMWNQRKISAEPGYYNIILEPTPLFVMTENGSFAQVQAIGEIEIVQKLYLGDLPLTKASVLLNESSGGLIMTENSEIITDVIDVAVVENTWMKLQSADDLAVTPTLTLTAYDAYPSSIIRESNLPKAQTIRFRMKSTKRH